jgi:hypothetical protein
MYAATNFTNLKYQNRGLLAGITVPPLTPDLIRAMHMPGTPTELPEPSSAKDFFKPRGLLGMNLYRAELLGEFLLRRFPNGELPKKGSVPNNEIESISKFDSELRFPNCLITDALYRPIFRMFKISISTCVSLHGIFG